MDVLEYCFAWLNVNHLFTPVQCLNDEMEMFTRLLGKLRELPDKPMGHTRKIYDSFMKINLRKASILITQCRDEKTLSVITHF